MAFKDALRLNIKGNGLPSRPDQSRSKGTPERVQNEIVPPVKAAPAPEKPLPPVQLPSPPTSPEMVVPGSFSPVRRGQDPISPPPPVIETILQDEEDPLEDYIPEPEEPEPVQDSRRDIDAAVIPREGKEGINGADDLPPPPQPEPIPVPLTKIHFACYQSHKSMPVANNYWYSVPCMTCQKVDQQYRYRCTFCCLRICGDCFQSLQKCKGRSLAELLESSPTA